MQKPKLFVDMDGTLAEWKTMDIPTQVPRERIRQIINDTLYQENYYFNLKPNQSLVDAINKIIDEDIADVYILSCVLPENDAYPNAHPGADKNKWLDKYFGDKIPQERRMFVPDGEPKLDSLHKLYGINVSENDLLLDDYTHNLKDWASHTDKDGNSLRGCKFLNGINDTHKSWQGKRVKNQKHSANIYFDLIKKLFHTKKNQEMMPDKCQVSFVCADDFGRDHAHYTLAVERLSLSDEHAEYKYGLYQTDQRMEEHIVQNGKLKMNAKYGVLDVAQTIMANYNLARILSVDHHRSGRQALDIAKRHMPDIMDVSDIELEGEER